jgi:phosphatidyl-myo-inositol dimannoside synthase
MPVAVQESRADPKATVLFVTRRFPPSVGGMEALAADADRALRNVADVELVALRSSSVLHLAWFLPFALVRTALALARGRVSHVVCGDAIAWATVAPVLRPRRAKSAVIVHGLDLVFPNPLYQRWIRWALKRADRIVANSAATAAVAREHVGIDAARIVVVNPGVRCDDLGKFDRTAARGELVRWLDLDASSLIAVSLGRLVRRKGVAWFIDNVLPLTPDVTYLVAGDGPMRDEIESATQRSAARDRVRLLGGVDNELRELLLRGADVCVMPNVRVAGDMEGFGIVAVEAASRGALVLASALEGIEDAVIDDATGILVDPEQATQFVDTIRSLADDRARLATLANRYQHEACIRFSIERMTRLLPAAVGLDATDSA